jgi:hypothetical protein
MKIYIDTNFKCHIDNPNEEYREIETSYFDDKCVALIEGYRFVPSGESWTRSDGKVFTGEMIAPWKNYSELDAIQREYERELLKESQTELFELKSQKEDLLESYMTGVNSI